MSKELFHSLLHGRDITDSNDASVINSLRKKYPWSAHLNMMIVRYLKHNRSKDYGTVLNSASFTVPDRIKLYDYLHESTTGVHSNPETSPLPPPEEQNDFSEPEYNEPETLVSETPQNEIVTQDNEEVPEPLVQEEEIRTENETPASQNDLMAIIQQRLNELKNENQTIGSIEEKPQYKVGNKERINKFIEEDPRIQIDKNYSNEADFSEESTTENFTVVTETLAGIYALQGNTLRAIEIYNQLILKYPEKSSYFAAQIESLKKQD